MFICEPLAQLAEHRTFNPGVPGPSPGRLTIFAVPSSRGPGHRPFKAATRVRISLGPPLLCFASVAQLVEQRTRNAQVSGPNPDAGSTSDNIKTPANMAGVFFSVVLPILNHPLFLFSRPAIC